MSDHKGPAWPNGAKAAIALTIDNMGEAADLQRNLWPAEEAIGSHYSVTSVLPKFLHLLRDYDIRATFFIESWNLHVYPGAIRRIVDEGHEVAWHAWQHEPWSKLEDEPAERQNFARSFGMDGLQGFGSAAHVSDYKGFRPPGGIIHRDRTPAICSEYNLEYISPAAENAAIVPAGHGSDSIVILPFRWRTVDAYYYMESFSGLRAMKGVLPKDPQTPDVLTKAFTHEIDDGISQGHYVSLLFHPFLTNTEERLMAMKSMLEYLAGKRQSGEIWIAPCKDIAAWIRNHPASAANDPGYDTSQWR